MGATLSLPVPGCVCSRVRIARKKNIVGGGWGWKCRTSEQEAVSVLIGFWFAWQSVRSISGTSREAIVKLGGKPFTHLPKFRTGVIHRTLWGYFKSSSTRKYTVVRILEAGREIGVSNWVVVLLKQRGLQLCQSVEKVDGRQFVPGSKYKLFYISKFRKKHLRIWELEKWNNKNFRYWEMRMSVLYHIYRFSIIAKVNANTLIL